MNENEKFIIQARQKIESFKKEREPERLREASDALENVSLIKENDSSSRQKLRTESLTLWLTLLQILDRNLDPNFDPKDVPAKSVMPPATSNGIVYPPGANPAKIDDPKARAEYEKAVAENREKQRNYRLQTQLRRLNEFIPPRAEKFIKNSFTESTEDQNELKSSINSIIENPERKEDLLRAVLKTGN